MYPPRAVAAFGIVAFFLIYVLFSGVVDTLTSVFGFLINIPDFSEYNELRTLNRHEFPIGLSLLNIGMWPYCRLDEPSRRVIIVGDIHGMIQPLRCVGEFKCISCY